MSNASGSVPSGADGGRSVDLDAASSAPLHPAAREVLLAALDRGYADPRRLHAASRIRASACPCAV